MVTGMVTAGTALSGKSLSCKGFRPQFWRNIFPPHWDTPQAGGGQTGAQQPPERTRQGSPLEARLRRFRRLGVSTQGGKPACAPQGILTHSGGMSRPCPASPASAEMSCFVRLSLRPSWQRGAGSVLQAKQLDTACALPRAISGFFAGLRRDRLAGRTAPQPFASMLPQGRE